MGYSVTNMYVDIKKCKQYYLFLKLSLMVFLSLFIFLISYFASLEKGQMPILLNGTAGLILSLLMPISGFLYYISLGILAHKNNKSFIVWVGLSMLTSPIGFIVSFLLMRDVGQKNGWL